jgi:tropinone reductase I
MEKLKIVDMWNLNSKKILITGGTKGIGRVAVSEMLLLGASVLFTGRSEQEVKDLENTLRQQYDHVWGLPIDITNETHRAELENWVAGHWHKLDVLVNNAGINIRKASDAYTDEEVNRVLDTDLYAPFKLSMQLLPLLKKSTGAAIVNVASVAGLMDVRTGSPYGMAKAGLLQLTRNLAVELAEFNIRVNAVSPWFTETPLTSGLIANEEKLKQVLARTPLKRVAKPEEMASVIAFLAMEKASYITA